MSKMKKTFSSHIEDGLTFMGDSIHRAVISAKDHELETIKLGLISDDEKLRMLKRDLYEAARVGNAERVEVLNRAISFAGARLGNRHSFSQQLETDRKHRNSPTEQIYGILNSIILLGLLAAFFSFPATKVCDALSSHTQACQISRVIPTAISRFFSEPK